MKLDVEIKGKTIEIELVNPEERFNENNLFILGYYPDATFGIIENSLTEALEIFADYCMDKGYQGFIETDIERFFEEYTEEEIDDFWFPANGGQFYLQLPDMVETLDVPKYTYSITYEIITPESASYCEVEEFGFIVENETATIGELFSIAEEYNLTTSDGAGWLYNTEPEHDREYFEKGHETFYSLHIEGQDHNNKDLLNLIEEYMSI